MIDCKSDSMVEFRETVRKTRIRTPRRDVTLPSPSKLNGYFSGPSRFGPPTIRGRSRFDTPRNTIIARTSSPKSNDKKHDDREAKDKRTKDKREDDKKQEDRKGDDKKQEDRKERIEKENGKEDDTNDEDIRERIEKENGKGRMMSVFLQNSKFERSPTLKTTSKTGSREYETLEFVRRTAGSSSKLVRSTPEDSMLMNARITSTENDIATKDENDWSRRTLPEPTRDRLDTDTKDSLKTQGATQGGWAAQWGEILRNWSCEWETSTCDTSRATTFEKVCTLQSATNGSATTLDGSRSERTKESNYDSKINLNYEFERTKESSYDSNPSDISNWKTVILFVPCVQTYWRTHVSEYLVKEPTHGVMYPWNLVPWYLMTSSGSTPSTDSGSNPPTDSSLSSSSSTVDSMNKSVVSRKPAHPLWYRNDRSGLIQFLRNVILLGDRITDPEDPRNHQDEMKAEIKDKIKQILQVFPTLTAEELMYASNKLGRGELLSEPSLRTTVDSTKSKFPVPLPMTKALMSV